MDKPLALIGGKGHFYQELEDEMWQEMPILAVHSLKDVPTYIPEGWSGGNYRFDKDQSDVFSPTNIGSLEELPQGAVVGTYKFETANATFCEFGPDLKSRDLRGTVNTRLRKLEEGQYDAIILAYLDFTVRPPQKPFPFLPRKLSP